MTGDELAPILAGDDADANQPLWARFDPAFYQATNPDIGIPAGEPAATALLRHYLQVGRFCARSPNAWFDEAWYLARYPAVAALVAAGRHGIQSGFEHYLLLGHADLAPHWLFDPAVYRGQVSEFALATSGCTDGYDHYLRSGAARGLTAHELFEPGFYLAANAVGAEALPAAGAFGHYLRRLWRDGEEGWTSPAFDLVAGARAAATVSGAMSGALHHALTTGTDATFPPALVAALRASWAVSEPSTGGIDAIGAHPGARGWFVAGWLGRDHGAQSTPALAPGATVAMVLRHTDGAQAARAEIALFAREDLAGQGDGFLAFVPAIAGQPAGALQRLDVVTPAASWRLAMPPDLHPSEPAALTALLQPLAARLDDGAAATAIRRHLAHPIPDGTNTLGQMHERVFFEVDEAMRLPSGDLVLAGWHLARAGSVRAIRLRRGWQEHPIRLEEGVGIDRPDVRDTVGRESGLASVRCGFMLRIPRVFAPGPTPAGEPRSAAPYIEIEMASGAIGQRPFEIGNRSGFDAIRFLLDRTDPAFGEADTPYDRVVGPAIASLQAQRTGLPASARRQDFGPPPAAPHISLVVPLYGRVDFLDVQLGIAAAQMLERNDAAPAVERLYVLDDPPRGRTAEALAVQAHLRFALPFSLLTLDENRGFAGASNVGLAHARGTYVCFLNSDVFPGTADWAQRLAHRLEADPSLGAVAARLLYEDGSIQHDGMRFMRLARIGRWRFPDHPGKGMRPAASQGLQRVPAATGACLMLRRDLALALGGFDEAYPVGDFEDADLCLKLRGMGLGVAVDQDTVLFHLERQSQAGSAEHWRMQLTLFNAWRHERRWQRLLDRAEAA